MRYLFHRHVGCAPSTFVRHSRYIAIGHRRWLSSSPQAGNANALRILFCGSDEFSVNSLEALHSYPQSPDSKVRSIDVATRTDKRTGRGLKNVTAPPIKHVAQRLGLALHQFDTFHGWSLPSEDGSTSTYINMVIAVSFGLLVPPRILNATRFGGLNVHPSSLPDLKGSAPIEHAILNGYTSTGITIQTLHPSKFDEGQIVLQTPPPGILIPNPDQIMADELRDILAPIGADMLVRSIKDSLFLQDLHNTKVVENIKHASKITTESRHIDFRKLNATQILRLHRALSRLWVRIQNPEDTDMEIRLILGPTLKLVQPQDIQGIDAEVMEGLEIGLPFAVVKKKQNIKHSSNPLYVKLFDSNILLIPEILISAMKAGPGAAKAAKADLFKEPLQFDGYNLYQFKDFPG